MRVLFTGSADPTAEVAPRFVEEAKPPAPAPEVGMEGIAESSPHDRALSRVLALWLDQDYRVRRFRAQHLSGGKLDWDKIEEWMRAHGPPPGEEPTLYVTIPVDPSLVWQARGAAASGIVQQGTATVEVSYADLLARDPQPLTISYVVPGDVITRKQPVRRGTALDDLLTLVTFLKASAPWSEAQASVYVLAGLTPLVTPLRIDTKVYNRLATQPRLRLEVDARMTQREVATAYQTAREQFVSETRHRDLSERALELAVWSLQPEGREGTWAARMARWNEAFPMWGYRNARNFASEARLAQQRLLPDLMMGHVAYVYGDRTGDVGGRDRGDGQDGEE